MTPDTAQDAVSLEALPGRVRSKISVDESGFVITCPNCRSELLADPGARLVHHDDGTHTFIPATGEAKTNE